MVYDNNVNLNEDPRAKIRFYPYQESYRLPVTLQEDPSVSKEASDDKKYFVTFELHGKPYRLHFKSYSRADGNASFFITDETSNKPGYTGGRMMSFQFKANMQVGEQDEIDLNFLEYPPCKVNSFFACDATTDHLPILIEAGEQSWED